MTFQPGRPTMTKEDEKKTPMKTFWCMPCGAKHTLEIDKEHRAIKLGMRSGKVYELLEWVCGGYFESQPAFSPDGKWYVTPLRDWDGEPERKDYKQMIYLHIARQKHTSFREDAAIVNPFYRRSAAQVLDQIGSWMKLFTANRLAKMYHNTDKPSKWWNIRNKTPIEKRSTWEDRALTVADAYALAHILKTFKNPKSSRMANQVDIYLLRNSDGAMVEAFREKDRYKKFIVDEEDKKKLAK